MDPLQGFRAGYPSPSPLDAAFNDPSLDFDGFNTGFSKPAQPQRGVQFTPAEELNVPGQGAIPRAPSEARSVGSRYDNGRTSQMSAATGVSKDQGYRSPAPTYNLQPKRQIRQPRGRGTPVGFQRRPKELEIPDDGYLDEEEMLEPAFDNPDIDGGWSEPEEQVPPRRHASRPPRASPSPHPRASKPRQASPSPTMAKQKKAKKLRFESDPKIQHFKARTPTPSPPPSSETDEDQSPSGDSSEEGGNVDSDAENSEASSSSEAKPPPRGGRQEKGKPKYKMQKAKQKQGTSFSLEDFLASDPKLAQMLEVRDALLGGHERGSSLTCGVCQGVNPDAEDPLLREVDKFLREAEPKQNADLRKRQADVANFVKEKDFQTRLKEAVKIQPLWRHKARGNANPGMLVCLCLFPWLRRSSDTRMTFSPRTCASGLGLCAVLCTRTCM